MGPAACPGLLLAPAGLLSRQQALGLPEPPWAAGLTPGTSTSRPGAAPATALRDIRYNWKQNVDIMARKKKWVGCRSKTTRTRWRNGPALALLFDNYSQVKLTLHSSPRLKISEIWSLLPGIKKSRAACGHQRRPAPCWGPRIPRSTGPGRRKGSACGDRGTQLGWRSRFGPR